VNRISHKIEVPLVYWIRKKTTLIKLLRNVPEKKGTVFNLIAASQNGLHWKGPLKIT